MKKYIIAGIGSLAVVFVSLYAATSAQKKPQLSKDLLAKTISFDAKFDPEVDKEFKHMIMSAQDIYSPREFKDFITTEDRDGWNIFMHYAANGQAEQLSWLLDLLKKLYGNNQETLFNILYNKDKYGRSLLYIAIDREHIRTVEVLLKKIRELLTDKDLLFAFIESPDDLTKWTPLMFAAYLNDYEIMKLILQTEVDLFGQAPERLQRNLRRAYALGDAKGKELIQQYHNFPETKKLQAGKSGVAV